MNRLRIIPVDPVIEEPPIISDADMNRCRESLNGLDPNSNMWCRYRHGMYRPFDVKPPERRIFKGEVIGYYVQNIDK